jgi:23S rRNA pseudouridine1911/1915/1917 synthase
MAADHPSAVAVPPEAVGKRADVWLASSLDELSRGRIQALMRDGSIALADGAPLKPHTRLSEGMELTVRVPPPEPVSIEAEAIPLDIVHEDADIVVVNKPAGLVVHPAPGHPRGTLVNALLAHCEDLEGVGGELRPGIVHRLDRDTSGVIVVAKCHAAMDSLAMQFRRRQVEKEYVAIVHGIPHPGLGTVETQIGRSSHDRKKMSAFPASGRDAVSRYHVSEVFDAFCRVSVTIETGRTHQIRVHMAHIRHPIVGDRMYGKRGKEAVPVPVQRQMLHAARLTLTHPSSRERMTFEAPLPDDMQELLEALRG